MLSYFNPQDSKVKKEKEDYIQDIIPSTIEVNFNSTELGQVYDYSAISYHNVKDPVFERKKDDVFFTLSSDGSQHAEWGTNLVLNEFVPLIDDPKVLVVYIYFSSKDHEYNFSNRKENVVSKYSEILSKYKKFSNFLIEDRWTKNHPLFQVCIHAERNKTNFLVIGFHGIKGAKGENKELGAGVDYLLGHSRCPSILIKENIQRGKKKSKGFKWLFILDKEFVNRIRLLQTFEALIDRDRDTVVGLGLYPVYVHKFDLIEKEFVEYIEKIGVKSYSYEVASYTGPISEVVLEKVNFGLDEFDFTVFYNNANKHQINPSGNDNVKLVLKCACNICFINI